MLVGRGEGGAKVRECYEIRIILNGQWGLTAWLLRNATEYPSPE